MKYFPALKKLLLLILILCKDTEAGELTLWGDHKLQYSGYIGAKTIVSSADVSSTFDGNVQPEVGLNVVYDKNNFQIFNQFRYGEHSGTYLVYNFAQYTFTPVNNLNISIKGGKLKNDFLLYNATRVNPGTRQGVIQPQSIYWESFDEFFTSGLGIGTTIQYKEFEIAFAIEEPTVVGKHEVAHNFYGPFMNEIETKFGGHLFAGLTYSSDKIPLVIKFNWSRFDFGNKTSPVIGVLYPGLFGKNVIAELLGIGAEYRWNDLTLSGEAIAYKGSQTVEWTNPKDSVAIGYSLSARYALTEHLDIRGNYNRFDFPLQAKLDPVNAHLSKYQDVSLGFNYHINNWMFQTEAHYIEGGKTVDIRDSAKDPGAYKSWWMVGANIVYSF